MTIYVELIHVSKIFHAGLQNSYCRVSTLIHDLFVHNIAGSIAEWKDAILVIVWSIKDLLKALKLAQAIPHNFIITPTTAAEAIPLAQTHQQVDSVNKVFTCIQRQPSNPSIIKTRQHTSQPLVLEYSSPNVPALVPSTATAAAQFPPTCKPLRIQDQGIVCRYLHPLRSKWMVFGTFLCVDHSSLEAMEADKYTCDEKIVKLVALWLRQISPPPTWQALVDAVEHLDPSKAEEIRREQFI